MTSQNPVWLRTMKQTAELRKDAADKRDKEYRLGRDMAKSGMPDKQIERVIRKKVHGEGHSMEQHGEGKEYGDK